MARVPGLLLLSASLVLSLASCSSAPQSSPAPGGASEVQRVRVVCNAAAKAVSFASLGVPEDEKPLDVALTRDYIWVLFAPARVLRLRPAGEGFEASMKLGEVGDVWTSLEVDPVDESIWLASENSLALKHLSPGLRLETVKLDRVEGEGGFWRFRVAPDAIYAVPTCARTGVWRIDRTGKILGTAFPARAGAEDQREEDEPLSLEPSQVRCAGVYLERDAEGRIVAWDGQKSFGVDSQGTWAEIQTPFFFNALPTGASEGSSVVKGVNVGGKHEAWYLDGWVDRLFFWKGRPVFLGAYAAGGRIGSRGDRVLVLPEPGGTTRDLVESCPSGSLLDVATSETRYAGLTERGLVLGELATAADLP